MCVHLKCIKKNSPHFYKLIEYTEVLCSCDHEFNDFEKIKDSDFIQVKYNHWWIGVLFNGCELNILCENYVW